MDHDDPEKKIVLHEWNIIPSKPKKAPFHAPQAQRLAKILPIGPGPVTWTIEDIANAGRLLNNPPLPVNFADEQEMRRVYTLIYDVFRYKNILSQSLDDVLFFAEHPDLTPMATRVWLLLFDLYHRSFKKRTTANAALAALLFPEAGIAEIEKILWEDQVRLAAAIARIRIKNKALRLSQLLPHHLRDSKNEKPIDVPLTCWINTKKIKSADDLTQSIKKSLKLSLIDENIPLSKDTFKWDPHCPQFIIFDSSQRSNVMQSKLVKSNKLIVQDKAFCLGPATFVKIITDLQLTGSVIQSHVNSPRTTAYLASILSQNDNISKLLAFSAGNRKTEYENYFNDLGIKNISIFSEKMIDLPPDSNSLEEVIAVFATPPNSYSAIADPIDFVCSRGGDLAMLEVLTETEDTAEGRKRVAMILEEQKQTLKFAMSRPQIQFVLYETHSEIDAENDEMIKKTLNEMNKYAQIYHAQIQGKLKGLMPQKDQLGSESTDDEFDSPVQSPSLLLTEEKQSKIFKDLTIPQTDLFDIANLPDLCPNSDQCLDLVNNGCYLALVQRKQVNRMDNKYMIQMAENRGVFGADPNNTKKPNKNVQRKRAEEFTNQSPLNKPKRRIKDIDLNRLQTATKASMGHSKTFQNDICCRTTPPNLNLKVSQPRRWWTETTRHITNLRASVSKQKLFSTIADGQYTNISSSHSKANTISGKQSQTNTNNNNNNNSDIKNVQKFVNRLLAKGGRVDEVAARSRQNPHSVPIHPKLRLSRYLDKIDNKVPVPIAVTVVTYPPQIFW